MDAPFQLERCYAEIGPALLAYLRRRCVPPLVAEDLLQETFLRAWRQRERWPRVESERGYLFGVARHVWLDARRRLPPTAELDPALAAPSPADSGDPRLEQLRSAIAMLPEPAREVLHLKLQEELSYAEIAAALEIPIGTVRSRLHHAVLKLQRSLTRSADGSPAQTFSHERRHA